MIVFLIFFSSAHGVSLETHRITEPGETSAFFKNQTAIFLFDHLLPPSYNISISNSNKDDYYLINYDVGRSLSLTNQNILLNCSINCSFTYSLWKTPNELCKDAIYVLNLDSGLEFNINSDVSGSSICLIPQTNERSTSFSLYPSNGEILETTFYTSNNQTFKKNGKNIHFTSDDSYLIQITANSSYTATIDISAKQGKNHNTECSVKHSSLFDDNGMPTTKNGIKISNLTCESASESYLIGLLLLTSVEIILILLVALLHLSGMIDIGVILGCTQPDAAFGFHIGNASKIKEDVISDHGNATIEREPCEEV